jgi:hypothetical protein
VEQNLQFIQQPNGKKALNHLFKRNIRMFVVVRVADSVGVVVGGGSGVVVVPILHHSFRESSRRHDLSSLSLLFVVLSSIRHCYYYYRPYIGMHGYYYGVVSVHSFEPIQSSYNHASTPRPWPGQHSDR